MDRRRVQLKPRQATAHVSHVEREDQFGSRHLGLRTPEETAAKKKPWINAGVEKALTGRYFRHMFREGRVIIPGGGWCEWTVEGGKKQPWYITARSRRRFTWLA
jgi:putative SOS response-associated peptidase YedK